MTLHGLPSSQYQQATLLYRATREGVDCPVTVPVLVGCQGAPEWARSALRDRGPIEHGYTFPKARPGSAPVLSSPSGTVYKNSTICKSVSAPQCQPGQPPGLTLTSIIDHFMAPVLCPVGRFRGLLRKIRYIKHGGGSVKDVFLLCVKLGEFHISVNSREFYIIYNS